MGTQNKFITIIYSNIIVMSVYCVCGYFNLTYISGPVISTAIWIPAGVGLGAVIVWGLSILPGLFIAELLLFYYLIYANGSFPVSLDSFLAYTAICTSYVFSAAIFLWLVNRYIGLSSKHETVKDILLFAFLSGPVAATVNATVGALALHYGGFAEVLNSFVLTWLGWWVNDTLGQLIFTPMFILVFSAKDPVWRKRILQIALPVAIAFSIIILSYYHLNKLEKKKVTDQFRVAVNQHIQSVQYQVNRAADIVNALAAEIMVMPELDSSTFDVFTQQVMLNNTYIQALQWAPMVEDKKEFERQHASIFSFKNQVLFAGHDPSFYFPVLYARPFLVPKNKIIGLDLLTQPVYQSAIFQMIHDKKTTMSAPVDMFNLGASEQSFLLFRPVYKEGALLGAATVVIKVYDLIHSIIDDQHMFSVFSIGDVAARTSTIYYYDDSSKAPGRPGYDVPVEKSINLFGQRWRFYATPSASFLATHYYWHLWFILIPGFLFCSFLSIGLFVMFGQKKAVEVDLALATVQNSLLLNSVGEGIYGLDRRGLITFINPAAVAMLGYSGNELLGKPLRTLIQHSTQDGAPYCEINSPISASFHERKKIKRTEEKMLRKNAQHFLVDYTSTPIVEENKVIGVVVVFSDVTKRVAAEKNIRVLACSDSLTKLPNRATFMNYLAQLLEMSRFSSQQFAVCFIDLDDFKQVNDTLGHAIGDKVLLAIAAVVQSNLRQGDYFARLGGDEFGLIVDGFETPAKLVEIIQGYGTLISQPVEFEHIVHVMTASIGVVVCAASGVTSGELIKNADIAMYQAKKNGKNTFAVFDEVMNMQVRRRHAIEVGLLSAIDNNELSLCYQPQVNSVGGKLHGVEALLRWTHPVLGAISPAEFIPISEDNGAIQALGAWVAKQCCADYSAINNVLPSIELSMNVSVRQLENVEFINLFYSLIERYKIPANKLCIEVTETALMINPEQIKKIVVGFDRTGIRFSLDDFGMGYSSMSYIKHLPMSYVKIDQSFMDNIIGNKKNAAIVRSIIQLSHSLNAMVVAEGVQTQKQLGFLADLGCDIIQGFVVAKPMPLDKLLLWGRRYQAHISSVEGR